MVTTGGSVVSLIDWAKRLDPDGKTADVINLLSQENEMLEDIVFQESNGPTQHRTTVQVGEPTIAFRTLNAGTSVGKSTTAQIDESMGMIQHYIQIDKDLADLNGNTSSFVMTEVKPALSAINKLAAQTLIYGDTRTNPERFMGLAPRFSALTSDVYDNSMITGGGSGSVNTSIWLVCWGPHSVHGIFPKGTKAGLVQENKGQVTVQTGTGIDGGLMEAYRIRFAWHLGLAVRDWRYVVRICNVDITNLTTESSNADLIKLMSKALDRPPSFEGTKPCFYVNRTVFEMLRIQALGKSANALKVEDALDQFGNPVKGRLSFSGIPIRKMDQLLNTESTIS